MAAKKVETNQDTPVSKDQQVSLKDAPSADTSPHPTIATHCPYRQAALLQQAITPDKMRVAFLLGAGCAMSIRVENGKLPLIPDIAGMTKDVREHLEQSAAHKPLLDAVVGRITNPAAVKPTIEDILSMVRALREVVGQTSFEGLSMAALDVLDKQICDRITTLTKVQLPSESSPFHQLATWTGAISREHAVELFTSNYDLLLEQALESRQVPYFDGFVGSDRTFFDLNSIEMHDLPARWARLWKVHGSTNWWRTPDGRVERRASSVAGSPADRQMIHPSHLKYDQSRRMPYLAMLDRLKSFLAHDPAVLITCGYSFSDQHLNEVILQALNRNPTAICFGLLYGDRANYPEAVRIAQRRANLNLLAVDGGILGTVERDWTSKSNESHPLHGSAVANINLGTRTASPDSRCKFLLGDFNALGAFLAQQLADRMTSDKGDSGHA